MPGIASNRKVEGTFKKCDMHVHSSSCYSRSYDKRSFFKSVLESDLDVLAITDHNVIDVPLLKELQKQMEQRNKILFAGVELNVRLKPETIKAHKLVLGDGRKGSYFHAIVWCSMEHASLMSSIVDDLFITEILDADPDGNTTDQHLKSLPRKGFSRRTEGLSVCLEDFQEMAATIPHFLIPHENKDRSLSDYLPNGSRKKPLLDNQAFKDRLFYYSHAMAVEGGEKSRRHISEGLSKGLQATVASLFFSDAKELPEIGSKFTWIDFDRSLDSLLLAISDPESRIRTSDVQDGLPQANTDSFLESVSFKTTVPGNKSKTRSQTIWFSPGYNGIVGSRGGGKSFLACLLANEGLDTYSEFVDADSIRFMTRNGISTRNRPPCLYLGQGELEDIYKNGSYEEIPFLKDRVTPLRENAEQASRMAQGQLREIVDLEAELLTAFSTKYSSGVVRIDYLDEVAPAGITVDQPAIPESDEQQIVRAKETLASVSRALGEAASKAKPLRFEAAYPEDETLFAALESEATGIMSDLESLMGRVGRLSALLGEYDPQWFEIRDSLVALFVSTLASFNRSGDSSTLSQYNERAAVGTSFFEDLLELRLELRHLDQSAAEAYERMLKPISPVEFSNGNEEIVVSLVHDEDMSFTEQLCQLVASSSEPSAQALVHAFLLQSDRQKMHKVFNGTKMRSVAKAGLAEHQNKYFELLVKNLESAGSLKVCIAVDGKPIDDMSPGMKAQALLKLFLNDEIITGQWMYVVLDQPEDNLDVATIKDFLVDRLKRLKFDVQLFVVSHSAPVIVNGDARTVVVCKNQGGDIQYSHGTIIDQAIKRSIADVLDGGERYLKMRLNKYNFQVGDAR